MENKKKVVYRINDAMRVLGIAEPVNAVLQRHHFTKADYNGAKQTAMEALRYLRKVNTDLPMNAKQLEHYVGRPVYIQQMGEEESIPAPRWVIVEEVNLAKDFIVVSHLGTLKLSENGLRWQMFRNQI